MFNKKYIFKLLIINFLIITVLLGCQRKSHEINPGIKVHFNKLNIIWNGVNRINGALPALENTNLKFHEVHTVEKDTTFVFEFLHNFEDHVEIKAIISPSQNTIIFYVSPNNYHSQKARDFVGILFEDIPGLTEGKSYENGTFSRFQSVSEFKSKNAELLILKYKDNAYVACVPLMDKGYKATVSVYNNKPAFKSYHSNDGQIENDIPIAAMAFGTDPTFLLNSLLKEPLLKSNKTIRDIQF